MSFTVAIVGRPNVGKSTFFNRLIGQRQAIIDDMSGVTRDRQYGVAHWTGKDFNVIDTGGFVAHSEDVFEKEIREQVRIAIEEASLLIFMVDVTTGITGYDEQMAQELRKSKKEVLLLVNKVDNTQRSYDANEFYGLGFPKLFCVSSINGSGTGELLDEVVQHITDEYEEKESDIPRMAIVGQPNVGKSSLLNALIGEKRNIVTDIAGTTRDSIHSHYKLYNKDLLLIDTAGIRKKGKVHENLEFYSVIRAIKAVDECDVAIVVIDATLGIEGQDLAIFGLAEKKKKGIVLVVNKWDLVEDKETNTIKEFEEAIKKRIAPMVDVPILFVSALEKQRIHKVMDSAMTVYKNRQRKIPTSQLNDVMLKAIEKYHPPAVRGNYIKIKYVSQLPIFTPTFAFFSNYPKDIKAPYRQYLENQLRNHFDFSGVPIRLVFRKK